jgi:hypothetical protein
MSHQPATDRCRHGVPWSEHCERCERREIAGAIDRQLAEAKRT